MCCRDDNVRYIHSASKGHGGSTKCRCIHVEPKVMLTSLKKNSTSQGKNLQRRNSGLGGPFITVDVSAAAKGCCCLLNVQQR